MASEQQIERRGFLVMVRSAVVGLAAWPLLSSAETAEGSESKRTTLSDLVRPRQACLPRGEYDHQSQQLRREPGANAHVQSSTFWDGERS